MARRFRNNDEPDNLNIWPSFTDLMSNAFMIISLFLLLALFKSLFLKTAADESKLSLTEVERKVLALERELRLKNLELNRSQRQLKQKNDQIADLTTQVNNLKLAPPVVVIENSGDFQFDSGSAELSPKLRNYIQTDLTERIEEITAARDIYIVEIIGHTDGQATFSGASNLDENLENVALGEKKVSELYPGSNADLGLMRALEVVKELQAVQKQGRLEGIQFRAYSAAQLLLPSGEFANPTRDADASRRRIEIRFSPLGQAETVR
jgi:flagellar motor protein MotB